MKKYYVLALVAAISTGLHGMQEDKVPALKATHGCLDLTKLEEELMRCTTTNQAEHVRQRPSTPAPFLAPKRKAHVRLRVPSELVLILPLQRRTRSPETYDSGDEAPSSKRSNVSENAITAIGALASIPCTPIMQTTPPKSRAEDQAPPAAQ